MRHSLTAIIFLAVLRASAGAEPSSQPVDPVRAKAATIVVTINPEDRVSVILNSAPEPAPHGSPLEFEISIINQGFSTGILEARLVDSPAGATLDFRPERLSGDLHETRHLRIRLSKDQLTDLTIAFRLANEAPDLGGRDRVHFLARPL